jgi:hypothetical protein
MNGRTFLKIFHEKAGGEEPIQAVLRDTIDWVMKGI